MIGRVTAGVTAESRSILYNSLFLIANTVGGSAFGFVAWVVAAHTFMPAAVGSGAAYLSALTFLEAVAEMGLGTAIVRFAPQLGRSRTVFINSALLATATASAMLAGLFVWSGLLWSNDVAPVGAPALSFGIFVGSAAAFGLAQIVDRIFVAFQVSGLLFGRNLVANLLRIALLLGPVRSLGGLGLVLAIGGPALLTSALALRWLVPRAVPGYRFRPVIVPSALYDKAAFTVGNHVAVLAWSAPQFAYPLLVVAVLGPGAGAQFYLSWMLANILFIVPASVSTSTFARAAHEPTAEARAFWKSMLGTTAILVPATGVLLLTASSILGGFGRAYTADGNRLLFPLALSVFPYTVNLFAIADLRIRQKTVHILVVSLLGAGLCLALSLAGAEHYGLRGVGLGWLAGQLLASLALISTNLAAIWNRLLPSRLERYERFSPPPIHRG